MREDTWSRLNTHFREFPVMQAESVTEDAVSDAARVLGLTFEPDYAEFIHRYGAAIVGPNSIIGLGRSEAMSDEESSVVEVTLRFRAENWPGVDEWYVISVDAVGNPVGVARDGTVWLSDHDRGTISRIADSFEQFIRRECLRIAG